MGITADGFFDWAIRDPGPPWKTNGGRDGGKGMIPHSMEGRWEVARDILWGPRRSSWEASNCKDGRFFQHYSIFTQAWTSGAGHPNNNFFAIESEGQAGEPLTQPQIDNLIHCGRDLIAVQGWQPRRPTGPSDPNATLWEHNEMTRFGALPTACPSGRIPWDIIVPALEGGEMPEVTKGEFQAAFAFSLETRRLVVSLGHGLAAIARQTGVNQQEIDDIEAELQDAEQKILDLAKVLSV